jgi:hypothetical protein
MLQGGKGYVTHLLLGGSGRRRIRMSAEENKALARRWVEGLFNEGNLGVADEILSPDFVLHAPFDPRELRGSDAVKQFVSAYRQAFPDGHTTIEDQIAEGDKV